MKTIASTLMAALMLSCFIASGAEESKVPVTTTAMQACGPDTSMREIDTKLFIDIKGKRIYTCCQDCLDKIKADPEKFIKDMEAGGVKFDSLENCHYFIEKKTHDSKNWDYKDLKKIVTPVEMTLKDTNSENAPKIELKDSPKIVSETGKKVVTLTSPKIVSPTTPKVEDETRPHIVPHE